MKMGKIISRKAGLSLRKRFINYFKSSLPKKWVVYKGKKHVALTFDDGPDPKNTPGVLDILDSYDIKATFFLVGRHVEKNRALVKRMYKRGHIIGNHSYSHNGFKKLSSCAIMQEIRKTQKVIKKTLGVAPKFYRPPQGLIRFRSILPAMQQGLKTVLWSYEKYISPNGVKEGDIVLFHDDNKSIVKILPHFIEELKKKGYEFITLEEL